MKATFHELASLELEEAIEHYDRKAAGLGDRLLAEVRAATAFIETHPRSSQEIERKIRRKVLVKGPHGSGCESPPGHGQSASVNKCSWLVRAPQGDALESATYYARLARS